MESEMSNHNHHAGPASFIDIVDDNDKVVGATARNSATHRSSNFRVVHVFVLDDQNQLLLSQLGSVRTNDPGLWGSSVAAHLWAGENYAHAAQRRLYEELGIKNPVQYVDTVRVSEGGRTKFAGLFRTSASNYVNREPDHIATLRFEPLDDVIAEVSDHPERFTTTFRELLRRFT